MRFVKQVYAGWIGVSNATHYTSGVFTFELNKGRLEQLTDVVPTVEDVKECLVYYKQRNFSDPHGFKKFMEDYINDPTHTK